MIVYCLFCGSELERWDENDYFEVSYSPTGKDLPRENRIDGFVCQDCILDWVSGTHAAQLHLIIRG